MFEKILICQAHQSIEKLFPLFYTMNLLTQLKSRIKQQRASKFKVQTDWRQILVILHFAGSSFLIYYYGSRFLQKSYPGRRLSIDFVKYLFQSPT